MSAPSVWLPKEFSFLSGYATPVRRRRILVPMQAIADDSGSGGQGQVIVMAGLIGRAEWWADFSDRWDACLKEPPAIRYFKFYQAAHRKGQFAGFSEQARDNKMLSLVQTLDERHPFTVLHVTVNLAEHTKAIAHVFPKRSKRLFPAHGAEQSPYFDAYSAFVRAACVHLWRQGEREQFDFIVDEHPSLGWRAKEWYPAVRAAMPEEYRSIMPAEPITKNDEPFLPLQAADLIAGLQRDANTPPLGTAFAWLADSFTNVKPSPMCEYHGAQYFAELISRVDAMRKAGPPPSNVMLAVLQIPGVPIRLGE